MGDDFQQFGSMFSMMQVFFWLFFVVVIGLIVFTVVKQGSRWAKNNASPEGRWPASWTSGSRPPAAARR